MDEVVKADRDGDDNLSYGDIRKLRWYMQSMKSAIFHENRFDAIIMKTRSMKSLMQVVKNLLDDEVPDSEKVFELNVDDVASRKVEVYL